MSHLLSWPTLRFDALQLNFWARADLCRWLVCLLP